MTKMMKARAYRNKEGVENDKNGNRQGTQKEEEAKTQGNVYLIVGRE